MLAAAGARVAVLEEGGHYTRRDFNMQESWAYPALYQEHGNRATDDLSIMILQGRSVGGGTTVNWTSSFRTPERHAGALGASATASRASTRRRWRRTSPRSSSAWTSAPATPTTSTATTASCRTAPPSWAGSPQLIRRNVKGCARLGYCGMGCPLDAKQSARTTFLADAIAAGADLYSDCRAKLVETDRGRARARGHRRARSRPATARAGAWSPTRGAGVVLAGGAINTPALLLRSNAGTGSGQVGRRTFLHPTVPLVAFYDQPIEGFYGPPQSVAVHHFADRGERVGYFLETAPVHPMLAALAFPGFGDTPPQGHGAPPLRAGDHRAARSTATTTTRAATVDVNGDGRIKLRYPLSARCARRPSPRSPTWRACSWRPARAR